MAIAVEMPKMSDTMEEGVLVAWLADEGDTVSAGDVVAQVETDKATMDLEVYDDGVLLKRVVEAGSSVPIGGLIAVLGDEGEDISDILSQYDGAGETTEAKEAEPEQAPEAKEEEEAPEAAAPKGDGRAGHAPEIAEVPQDDGRVKASPLARRMAGERGIDLSGLRGSGPDGRIIKRDVEAALEGKGERVSRPTERRERAPERPKAPSRPAPSVPDAGSESVNISQMRRTIARRLAESKFTAPHFYLTVDLDVAQLVETRARLNADTDKTGRPKVSVNDFITKACASALRLNPWVNSSYLESEGEIRLHGDIHVAVAVAVDEGLLTPVIRHVDQKGLVQIASETRELAEGARDRKLQPADWEGSTFTTSNLGMFGIEEFTAIINPPNACILAIGAIRDVPVVVDGAVVPGKRMKVTLSCDHRVVDGATGARFLEDLRGFIEEPARMLL